MFAIPIHDKAGYEEPSPLPLHSRHVDTNNAQINQYEELNSPSPRKKELEATIKQNHDTMLHSL